MDELLNKSWFLRLASFVIALMLYTVVAANEPDNPPGLGLSTGGGEDEPRELENVELVAHYDENKYIISGLRETVTVQLEGPDNLINKAYLANDYEAFVNLEGKGPGTYNVPVETSGFPEELTVSTLPSTVNVTIHEKQTEPFPVQVEITGQDEVPEGYEIGEPTVTPEEVDITAAKEVIDRIAFAQASIDIGDSEGTVETTVPLKVYDKDGNELNVKLSVSAVNVKVPMTGPSGTVPVQIEQQGSLPDHLSIQSVNPEPHEITLFAPKKILDDIDDVSVPLKLDDIEKDETLELEVPVPEGVNHVSPETIEVTVDVAERNDKTFSDLSIGKKGLSDDLKMTFLNPEDGEVDVTLSGTDQSLKSIKRSDVDVHIDVSGLAAGKHTVPIEISRLQNNIEAQPGVKKAKIKITETSASNKDDR